MLGLIPLFLSAMGVITGVAALSNPDVMAFILGPLPTGGALPEPVHAAAIYFGHALASVDFVLPVADMIKIMMISYTITLTLFTLHLILMAFSLLRGIGHNKFH